MESPLGSSSHTSKVGYSVRFDKSVSPNTRIKFLTEGMLLQEMLHDPNLSQYKAVIVDEVHERSENVDLILGFLRDLVTGDWEARRGTPLKVVVMSATADVDSLLDFFDTGYSRTLPGDRKDDTEAADDNSEWSGISASDAESERKSLVKARKVNDQQNRHSTLNVSSPNVSVCHVEGRQYPVKIKHLLEPSTDYLESALKIVFQIHYKEPLPGDILVFLPGRESIEGLVRLVSQYALSMTKDVPKILPIQLYATLSPAAQQRIFERAPRGTRKVIIATNIAETSLTVPGIRFVVDSGKAKVRQFRSRTGFESLLVKPISQSSAIQRQGRARTRSCRTMLPTLYRTRVLRGFRRRLPLKYYDATSARRFSH